MQSKEYVFKFKDIFEPENILSQWILKLSIARNDFLYVHNRLYELKETDKSGENFYFFRIAVSHFKEAIKYLVKYMNHKEIIEFVNTMSEELKEEYNILLASGSPYEGSFVQKVIDPVRHNLFHYFTKDFEDQLKTIEDFYTRFIISGESRSKINLVFADDVSVKISFGDLEEDEFRDILAQLVKLLVAFIKFIDGAIGTYLSNKDSRFKYTVSSSK